MLNLVLRRTLTTIPILIGIILVAFLLIELMPGDPAAISAGVDATPEAIEQVRERLNLNDPWWERFADYVWAVAHGDLGSSAVSGFPIWDRIASALPVTLSLGMVALVFSVVLGVTGGTLAALRRGRLADRTVNAVSSVMQAVPPFLIGLALVVILAVDRPWFPAGGYAPMSDGIGQWLWFLLLPAFTLALAPAAELARTTRGALVDILEQDYIKAARGKGLADHVVIGKHAAKNAASPVVTVLGLQVGRLLSATVVVELIFAMPGFGALAINAVVTRDMALIQGVVLVGALGVLLANLVVDVSYGYFNPKVRG